MRSAIASGLLGVAAVLAACAEPTTAGPEGAGGSTATGTGATGTGGAGTGTTTATTTTGMGGAGGALVGGGGPGGASSTGSTGSTGSTSTSSGAGGAAAEVFAHSGTTLYKLDPTTLAVTTVGDFVGCGGSVIDIAIDKNGEMWGARYSALVKIDKVTADCTVIAAGNYPTSLSFVPAGVLDPIEEVLVGYVDAQYIRIDKVTGAVTNVGLLGGGYLSSGDIVSLIGGGTYLTVKGNGCSDCIVEVDPSTGAMTSMIGALGYTKVFGLAYWAGVAYGFTDAGQLVSIDVGSAASTLIPIPNAPVGLQFYGAGSTTAAPHM